MKQPEKEALSVAAIRDYWSRIEIMENPQGAFEDIILLCEEVERLEAASLVLLRESKKLLKDTSNLEATLVDKIRQEKK